MTRGKYDDLKRCNRAQDSRRAVAEELLKEYKACESPDYISYVCTLSARPTWFLTCSLQGSGDAEQTT
jgi:hypothetical protein